MRKSDWSSDVFSSYLIEAWHLPLLMRPALSLRSVRRIAVFVSRALIEELGRKSNLDSETQAYLKARAQARIEQDAERATPTPDAVIPTIQKDFMHGQLHDDPVTNAASLQHKAAGLLALSRKTGAAESISARDVDAKSGKASRSDGF